ncbi:MAG: DUF3592 domain-containing protein [Paracoccaceae bacterium]
MTDHNKKPIDAKKYYDKDGNEVAPPTIAERVKANKIMGYIGGALFAGFLLTIGYSIFENSKTIGVDGVVVDIGSVTNKSNRTSTGYTETTSYSHSFKFTDRDGVEHVADTVGRGRDSKYSLGDVVSIGYYADDFSKVRIRSWFGLWKIQVTLFGLGAFLIWFSFYAVKKIREEEQQ